MNNSLHLLYVYQLYMKQWIAEFIVLFLLSKVILVYKSICHKYNQCFQKIKDNYIKVLSLEFKYFKKLNYMKK